MNRTSTLTTSTDTDPWGRSRRAVVREPLLRWLMYDYKCHGITALFAALRAVFPQIKVTA